MRPPIKQNSNLVKFTNIQKSLQDVVTDDQQVEFSLKLFSLMNLAWQYIDTICDQCIYMGLEPTKKLVRRIRKLKIEYDRPRKKYHIETTETNNAEKIEDALDDDLTKLFRGLYNEVSKLKLSEDYRNLVIATQQALTIMDAAKIYAEEIDAYVRNLGCYCPDYCFVQSEFLSLYFLIPQFAGDAYSPNLQSRKLTAQIIVKKTKEDTI